MFTCAAVPAAVGTALVGELAGVDPVDARPDEGGQVQDASAGQVRCSTSGAKLPGLSAECPPTVTVIGPVPAPSGTVTIRSVAVASLTVALVPSKLTLVF